MEHEISSHTKKALATMGKPEHSIWEKLKEIALEIVIIIFAVMVSIWFHDRSEHKHQQTEVKEFLEGLRDDIQKDTTSIKDQIKRLEENMKGNGFLAKVDSKKKYAELKKQGKEITLNANFILRNSNSGNYESFESSGKLGYLENKELKKRILTYYHNTYPLLNRFEDKYDDNIGKMLDITPKFKESEDMLFDPYFQFYLNIQNKWSDFLLQLYQKSITESNKTLKIIDEELKKQQKN